MKIVSGWHLELGHSVHWNDRGRASLPERKPAARLCDLNDHSEEYLSWDLLINASQALSQAVFAGAVLDCHERHPDDPEPGESLCAIQGWLRREFMRFYAVFTSFFFFFFCLSLMVSFLLWGVYLVPFHSSGTVPAIHLLFYVCGIKVFVSHRISLANVLRWRWTSDHRRPRRWSTTSSNARRHWRASCPWLRRPSKRLLPTSNAVAAPVLSYHHHHHHHHHPSLHRDSTPTMARRCSHNSLHALICVSDEKPGRDCAVEKYFVTALTPWHRIKSSAANKHQYITITYSESAQCTVAVSRSLQSPNPRDLKHNSLNNHHVTTNIGKINDE